MTRIGFVGAGNMARALGVGIAKRGTDGAALVATDPQPAAGTAFVEATGGRVASSIGDLLQQTEVVVIAVKPQVLLPVLAEMQTAVEPRHLVISIVAGATLRGLARGLGGQVRTVRAMPNTPALVGEGMTVLVGGPRSSPSDLEAARAIFASVGRAVVVEDEAWLDAVTAVSGSGPGFLFAYAEAMLEAAGAAGLPGDLARTLVQQTIFGAAALWRESGEEVAVLRARVTSPGGTTQAGLEALDARGFRGVVRAAIDAATRRSRELSAS